MEIRTLTSSSQLTLSIGGHSKANVCSLVTWSRSARAGRGFYLYDCISFGTDLFLS